VLEDDQRSVLVGREGHLDLGRLVVGVSWPSFAFSRSRPPISGVKAV